MDSVSNDNQGTNMPLAGATPDAHGQAAYLLVESLIFALRDAGVITTALAIEIVDVAAEVKVEVADEWGDTPETMRRSIALIGGIGTSLRTDV